MVCEHKTVTKWPGTITDYKKHLQKKMIKEGSSKKMTKEGSSKKVTGEGSSKEIAKAKTEGAAGSSTVGDRDRNHVNSAKHEYDRSLRSRTKIEGSSMDNDNKESRPVSCLDPTLLSCFHASLRSHVLLQ